MRNINDRFIKLTTGISLLFLCSFLSCKKNIEFDELRQFMKKRIKIPTKQLNQKSCYLYTPDSIGLRNVNIIHIIKMGDCTGCVAETAASIEEKGYGRKKRKNISDVFIIITDSTLEETVYKEMCRARIKGIVYLDTCNAFIQANPTFPVSFTFRTFVMRKDGKVLLVGDPFKNEKMEQLFLKVIDKEKQRRTNEDI